MDTAQQSTPGIFATLGGGFRLYGRNFCRLIVLGFILTVIAAVFGYFEASSQSAQIANATAATAVSLPPSYWIGFIVCIFLNLWLVGAMFAVTGLSNETQKLGFFPALAYSAQRFPALLGAAIVSVIIVGVGGIVFVIPGLIFAIFLVLVKPLVIIDKKGVFSSISASWKLVYGSWWYTLGYFILTLIIAFACLLITFIISFVVSMIVGSIATSSHAAGTFAGPAGQEALQHILLPYTIVVFVICWSFIVPLMASFFTSLLSSVKQRKLARHN